MSVEDRADELADWYAEENPNGAEVLDDLAAWFGRFISVTDPADISLLALWAAHTWMAPELYTTPRLQIDSIMPECGKTTTLDHLEKFCRNPIRSATSTSPALIPRLIDQRPTTLLLDEVDRSLHPDTPGVAELLGVLNSGYRVGGSRPVLVPVKGGGWDVARMSTYAPCAMAGNNPNLPDDTRSRSIRLLLMPGDGSAEETDWELIGGDAARLANRLAVWADTVRDSVKGMAVDLPENCIGRSKEKWRPLKRVAVAASGHWPATADRLIAKGLAEDAAAREAGLKAQPPGLVLIVDLAAVWHNEEPFVPTRQLVARLIARNPDWWGENSNYGKALTETRFARMVAQASKATSRRPEHGGPRGFMLADLRPVWARLGIKPGTPPGEAGSPGGTGQPGSDDDDSGRVNRYNHVNRVDQGVSGPGDNPVMCHCGFPAPPGRAMHFDCERKHTQAGAAR